MWWGMFLTKIDLFLNKLWLRSYAVWFSVFQAAFPELSSHLTEYTDGLSGDYT